MDFHTWLNKKYIEWRGDAIGHERTQREFAQWIGISSPLLSDYLKRDGRIPRHKKTIDKLVYRFGPEVYEVLDIEPFDISTTSYLPPDLRDSLASALVEVNSEISLRGLSPSDPEAEEIVKKIFSKHGLKWARTTKS